MPITFENNWNGVGTEGYLNHDSSRSAEEVERLVRSVAVASPNTSLAVALMLDWPVVIEKGIHQRNSDPHIRVYIQGRQERYHINLKKVDYRGNTFVWDVESVT